MSLTLTQLQTELQEKLGSTANIKANTTSQNNALNRVLDRMQMNGNWLFTVRKKTFDYVPDILEYSLANYVGITDFKEVYRLNEFPSNDPRRFPGGENLGVHIKDNDKFLSVRLDGGTNKLVDGLTSLTNDDTWEAVGDADNLVADLKEYKDGSGSLKFDIDESASAEDYAGVKNTAKTAQDLTDYEDRSYFILDVYLPTASAITGITLLWGSSEAAYWSLQATAPIDGASFQDGWNTVKFKWSDATQTGTPDVTAIVYYEVRLDYAAGIADQSNARVSNLRLDIREQIDLEYFSTHMVKTAAGAYQARFSDGTDVFLGDDELKPLLLEWAYYELIRNTKTLDKGEITRSREEAEDMMRSAFVVWGYTRNKGKRRIMTRL
jgi:hypothetical protein